VNTFIKELMKQEGDQREGFKLLWKQDKLDELSEYIRANSNVYHTFVEMFMPCVMGHIRWKEGLKAALKNEAHFPMTYKTIHEEAFVILEIENKWRRYEAEAKYRIENNIEDHKKPFKDGYAAENSFPLAKWTQKKVTKNVQGQKKKFINIAWNGPGLMRYNSIIKGWTEKMTREQRVEVDKGLVEYLLAQKQRNENGGVHGAEAENRRARLEIYDSICTFQDYYDYHEGPTVQMDIQPPQVTGEASSVEEQELVVTDAAHI